MAAAASAVPGCGWSGPEVAPAPACRLKQPTPQDLLELSASTYRNSSKLYNEAARQGMRVYYDERLSGDVRVALLVPDWFPTAYAPFDWTQLSGQRIPVVAALRGTVQDLVGNTRTNLQLLYNKMVDDHFIPDAAADVATLLQGWLHTIMARHPALRPAPAAAAGPASAGTVSADAAEPSSSLAAAAAADGQGTPPASAPPPAALVGLDIHVTGHSLGGMLAEVVTVDCVHFAAAHGMGWRCTSFESPGLPDMYIRAAHTLQPSDEFWQRALVGYLSAPNPINMLYGHLGSVIHVLAPWEHTWSHTAKCVAVDVARVTGWVVVGSVVASASGQLVGALRKRSRSDEEGTGTCPLDGAAAALPSAAGAEGATTGSSTALVIPSVMEPAAPSARHLLAAGLTAGVASSSSSLAAAPGPVAVVAPLAAVAASATTAATAVATSEAVAAVAAAGTGAATATVVAAGTTGGSTAGSMAAAAGSYLVAAGDAAVNASVTHAVTGVVRSMGPRGLGASLGALTGALIGGHTPALKILKCLAGVLGVEVDELWDQHLLGSMRPCFDPHTGQLQARYARRMRSWPQLGNRHRVLLTACQQLAKWTLPSLVCRENLGVMNMFSRAGMVEMRCARLKGYEPECAAEELLEQQLMLRDGGLVLLGAPGEGVEQQREAAAGLQDPAAGAAAAAAAAAAAGVIDVAPAAAQDMELDPPPIPTLQRPHTVQQQQQLLEEEMEGWALLPHEVPAAPQQEGAYQQEQQLQQLAEQMLPQQLRPAIAAAAAPGVGEDQVHLPTVSIQLAPTVTPPEGPRDWILIEPLRLDTAPGPQAVGGSSGAAAAGGRAAVAAAAAAAGVGRAGAAQLGGSSRRQLMQGHMAPAAL